MALLFAVVFVLEVVLVQAFGGILLVTHLALESFARYWVRIVTVFVHKFFRFERFTTNITRI